jgi:hypothetical protein
MGIPFSILDLSPIVEGGDPAQALRNSLDKSPACEADELIARAQIFDHAARLRSFEIVAEIRETLRLTGKIWGT